MRFWDSPPTLEGKTTSQSKIESDAAKACGQSSLSKPMTLIGFSNGGNMALKICEENPQAFDGRVMVIAPTRNSTATSCQKKLAKGVTHSSFEKSTALATITSALRSAGSLGSGPPRRSPGGGGDGAIIR